MRVKIITLIVLILSSCTNCNRSKIVELHSGSIKKSIEQGFFIDSLELKPVEKCPFQIGPVNFWCEDGWRLENTLFGVKKSKMSCTNYFLKLTNRLAEVRFKEPLNTKWGYSVFLSDPDLGHYLQIENLAHADSIPVSIKINTDSCLFYFRPIKR
jgi:hypothetical protein